MWQYSYLRCTDNFFYVLWLLPTVIPLESHEIQSSKNGVAEKIGTEKFWVSDINFLAVLSPPYFISPLFFISTIQPLHISEGCTFSWHHKDLFQVLLLGKRFKIHPESSCYAVPPQLELQIFDIWKIFHSGLQFPKVSSY